MCENALEYAIRKRGLFAVRQVGFPVHFRGAVVGEYGGDVLVEDSVPVELRSVKAFDEVHAGIYIRGRV